MTAIDEFKGYYWPLSNFSPHPVMYDGETYWTAEAAFQAAKAVNPSDREVLASIKDPADAKRVGRRVYLRNDWEDVKVGIMRQILLMKFHANPQASRVLKRTGYVDLVEGNYWHDNFWGDCRCQRPSCVGPGKNMLGEILMDIRNDYR